MLINFNRYGFDGDEATSRWLATMPLSSMFHYLQLQDKVFALYYSVLHVWALGGHSVMYLRGLSVIFAAASLVVVYRLATMLFDRAAALWSIALLSASFLFIMNAERARAEIMMFFFCALATLFALDVVQKKDSRQAPWLFALFSSAAIYSHPTAIAWVGALIASTLAFSAERKAAVTRLALPISGIAVCAVVPLLVFTALDRFGSQIGWIGPITVEKLANSLRYFTAGGSVLGGLLLAIAFGAALRGGAPSHRANLYLTLFWLACSAAIVLLISVRRDIIQPYYYIYDWIPVAMLCGVGLEAIRDSKFRSAAPAILAAFALLNAYELANNSWRREDFRAAAAFLHGKVTSSDAIVIHAAYYMRAVYYSMQEQGNGAYISQIVYPRNGLKEFREDPSPALAANVSREYGSVWLVLSHDYIDNWPGVAGLFRKYPHSKVRTFKGVRLVHLWRDAGTH